MVALLAAGPAACAKKPLQTPAVAALAIPTPPARVLIPVELPEYVEPEPEPVAAETPAPTPARSASNNRSTEKPATPAAPPAAEATPPPILLTSGNPGEQERRIMALIGSAEQRLKTVSFRDLNAAGRQHYEQARSFIRMANDNLSIKNYSLAEVQASRANRIAGLLGKG